MPELPEVENVKRILAKKIKGKTIKDISTDTKNMILDDFSYFKESLIGKTFKNFYRKGKYLIFELDDIFLVAHLRMEGKLFYSIDKLIDKHTHIVFDFTDSTHLYFKDVRKFGIMTIKKKDELFNTSPLNKVGPDPFELTDTTDVLNKINKSNKPIKEILLDQSIISGIGNIYADEILIKSSINPFKKGKDITKRDIDEIHKNAISIFDMAIKYNGTTIKSFQSEEGHIGGYQDFLVVHTKKYCGICGGVVKKEKIGGRSTYYCEVCQK
jgi:formamidopyrimidine-DNA glycosylase